MANLIVQAFTNRTKTGCQTCRKRKKKCDEGKPTCKNRPVRFWHRFGRLIRSTGNNCERGGFVCEGYTQRTAFPRTSAPKQHPTPIQSKDSFADHGTIQPRYEPIFFSSRACSHVPLGAIVVSILWCGLFKRPFCRANSSLHAATLRRRLEEHRAPAVTMRRGSADKSSSRTRPNPFVDVPSHIGPDGARRAPQQAIVIDDDLSSRAVSSEWGQPPIYGAGPTSRYGMNRYTSDALPGPFRGHLDRASSSSTVSGGVNGLHYEYVPLVTFPLHNSPLTPLPSVHQSPMAIARQGLEQMPGAAKAAPRTSFQSEKEKMRHGEEFNLLDGGLAREREACRASLHRFNASAATGISPDERERQLRTILEPEGAVHAGGAAGAPGSRLGKNVVVDAPFRCDYGFSINIRDGVWIEAGCVIADAAEVKICEGAHIGPDVKIVSRAEPWDPRLWLEERPGAPPLRRARGIRIVIEERVKIGAGAVIAPEWDPKIGDDAGLLRIGMNSRILAGTVVTKVWLFFAALLRRAAC